MTTTELPGDSPAEAPDQNHADTTDNASENQPAAEGEAKPKRRRRSRGGRRRSKAKASAEAANGATTEDAAQTDELPVDANPEFRADDYAPPVVELGAAADGEAASGEAAQGAAAEGETPAEGEAKPKRRRRSRGGRSRSKAKAKAVADGESLEGAAPASDAALDEDEGDEGPLDDALEPHEDSPAQAAADDDSEPAPKARGKKRKMFLSVLPGEQVEVGVAEDGRIQEYYVEMLHQSKTKGNIYKGVIHNIDAGLQAAFVSYGAHKNGFLQIDEVHPEYYLSPEAQKEGRYPPIQKVLKSGMELLVQVVKEPTGTKGAFLTTYLSLAGRNFVLTPGREQMGISRKIEDEEERKRLKEMVADLAPGDGLGLIVRTVSNGETKASLKKDRDLLIKMWQEIRDRGLEAKAPALIHKEISLASRAVRDYLTQDVTEIWVDDQETAEQLKEMVRLILPKRQSMVRLHGDPELTLFERFNLHKQVEQIFSRHVTLPGGGEIVIDHTEALTAIDVNSGRHGGKKSFKDMIHRNNLEAAEEIVRQLRLRDIGGQIVVDFVETKDRKALRDIEKVVRAAFKTDRARIDVGRISRFGLMELVRQRMGSSALSTSNEPCPCCGGQGVRRNMEWQSIQALKDVYRRLRAKKTPAAEALAYETTVELAGYLLNHKREKLTELEERFGCKVVVQGK